MTAENKTLRKKTLINAKSGWQPIDWNELWRYRHLSYLCKKRMRYIKYFKFNFMKN